MSKLIALRCGSVVVRPAAAATHAAKSVIWLETAQPQGLVGWPYVAAEEALVAGSAVVSMSPTIELLHVTSVVVPTTMLVTAKPRP